MNASSSAVLTTVTGSDRLSRHLHERHAREQIAAGKRAWERPDILPVGAFWRRLATQLQQQPGTLLATRRLLSRQAMLCCWEQLVAESFADQPLLQLAGAARTALDAWLLCRDWLLDVDALADDPLEETRLMIDWGRRFEAECVARGWLPEYALPDAVLAALEQFPDTRNSLPQRIQLAGFLELPPREQRQWDALRELGVVIDEMTVDPAAGQVRRVACADARQEIAAVAAWARAQLARNTECRVGIVVPDLAARRAGLKRELLDALAPARLTEFSQQPAPFNFSLGEPLAQQPLAADALTWLALVNGPVTFADAARLCRSPYFGVATEVGARFELEYEMRRAGFADFTLSAWQALAHDHDCPDFAARLAGLRETARQYNAAALPSEWVRRFSQWLDAAGWCRMRPLDSNEYQAREAWNELLGRLAELDMVLGCVARPLALAWLRRFCTETLFQPRAAAAPVQVLGLLEATGMQFDAVWVMGLTDETLPAAPRPNPFLPVAVQRAYRLPQSSAEREQRFARDIFTGLCGAASEVVCSYPSHEKDAQLSPSPLLRALPEMSLPVPYPAFTEALFNTAPLEAVEDQAGPPHPGGELRGGMALLQNQSHCAFRAFAIHRLAAHDWPTPRPGPDAMTRGLLAHRALERLWLQWRDRATLERVHASGDLDAVIRATVTDVINAAVNKAPHQWRDSLRGLEIDRLCAVLRRWFENVELPRPTFEVREVEGRRANGEELHTTVHAGPLILRGKLDRVDRLHDGRELIIDYKTGEAPRPTHFFGERMAAPQLPAYLVARKQAGEPVPAGIAVANLRTGRESLSGVMQPEAGAKPGIAGMSDVTRHVNDWNEAIAHWEHAVRSLGEAFAAGDARVDPLPGACTYCHLATLCRIHELAHGDDEEGGDE